MKPRRSCSAGALLIQSRSVWGRNDDALVPEMVDLVAQAPNRNAKDGGRPSPVPSKIVEGLQYEHTLNFSKRATDKFLGNRVVERIHVIVVDSEVFR
jgi:hypothetical protein